MRGRKPTICPDEIISVILKFKDRVITEVNGEKVSENININMYINNRTSCIMVKYFNFGSIYTIKIIFFIDHNS